MELNGKYIAGGAVVILGGLYLLHASNANAAAQQAVSDQTAQNETQNQLAQTQAALSAGAGQLPLDALHSASPVNATSDNTSQILSAITAAGQQSASNTQQAINAQQATDMATLGVAKIQVVSGLVQDFLHTNTVAKNSYGLTVNPNTAGGFDLFATGGGDSGMATATTQYMPNSNYGKYYNNYQANLAANSLAAQSVPALTALKAMGVTGATEILALKTNPVKK